VLDEHRQVKPAWLKCGMRVRIQAAIVKGKDILCSLPSPMLQHPGETDQYGRRSMPIENCPNLRHFRALGLI